MPGTEGAGLPADGDEGQAAAAKTPEAPAAQANDETSTLRSRLAGQDAKITALIDSSKDAAARAAAAEAKLAQYETGKVGADEALRAQLQAAQERAEAAERATTAALRKAQFPEAFRELGDQIVAMDEDKLASLEARLTTVNGAAAGDATDGITPRVPNSGRPNGIAAGKAAAGETSADVLARLKTMEVPWG